MTELSYKQMIMINYKTEKKRRMPDYQNGKIYSIRSRSNLDLVYVGSTTQPLSKRFGEHKKQSNKIKTSKKIIDLGDAYIELIENFSCNSKEELLKREGEIMRSMDCVNKCNPVFIKCPHNKKKLWCKDCGGSQICSHNREKSKCKDCGGSQICSHNRVKSRCKDCGGGQICSHNRVKSRCKDCNNYYCVFCDKKFCNNQYLKYHNNSLKHIQNYITY
jgi:hypothetical protein